MRLLLAIMITASVLGVEFFSPKAFSATTNNFRATTSADYSITVTSTRILPLTGDRKYLLIQNKGSSTVYLKFNSAHSATEGIALVAGANYEPIIVPINSIYMESAAGIVTVHVTEGK